VLTTDPGRVDVDRVHGWLSEEAYWAKDANAGGGALDRRINELLGLRRRAGRAGRGRRLSHAS
jgi:hypothetical protein